MITKRKRVAIVQSCYIPWKGYFDLIRSVDEFIFYDDVQFTKRDWRNRNQIKTPQGLLWLTVPVKVKGKYYQSIRETEIDGTEWKEKHWKSIQQNYARASHFSDVAKLLLPLYSCGTYTHISHLNQSIIKIICDYLQIKTTLSDCSTYHLTDGKTERLIELCKQAGAGEYISGPSAKNYIIPELFEDAGIKLTWFDYTGYPVYSQLWGDFIHNVSIVDVLSNCGMDTLKFMKG